MNMVEKLAAELQLAMAQLDLLAGENENLEERNANLVVALEQAYRENAELEEGIAELNDRHGSSPATTDIAFINALLQQAADEQVPVEPLVPVVPIIETIDSVIARSLVLMDEGKSPRITTGDMLQLQEFRYRWIADETKDTL